jgi:hypothetical protein
MGLVVGESFTDLVSFVTGGMAGDVPGEGPHISRPNFYTNEFDMSDNLRNNVVFPMT